MTEKYVGGNALMQAEPKPKIRGFGETIPAPTKLQPDISPVKQIESITPRVDSAPRLESTPRVDSAPGTNYTPPPVQITPGTDSTPHADSAPRKGFLQLTNHYIYDIMPTLKPSDGYVLLYLLAKTHGFQQTTAIVTLNKIASACHISRSQARICLRALAARKHIKIVSKDENNPDLLLRGFVIEMLIPRVDSKPRAESTPGIKFTPIKEKDLKEINKRESATPDYKNCPDCQGSGFWYPEGTERGVAKCKHARLPEGK
jgi:hypothetical protein